MTLTNSQKSGLFATVSVHAVILLLLLYLGIVAPFQPAIEEAFQVDFGNSATGLGPEEPSAAEAPENVAIATSAEPVTKAITRPPSTPKDQGEEELVTQNLEKTVAIEAAAKKKLLQDKKAKLDLLKQKEQTERQERADELERQREEAAENRIRDERNRKIGAINSRAKNAFGGGKTDNGSLSSGQGNTYGPGNQGSPDGTPGTKQYGLGGGTGKGISFSLAGRNARSLPKPTFPGNESGIVVVEVTVDKFGKVTKAFPGSKGSNTVDPDLLEAARKAALEATFNTDQNAPAFQKGTITYHFILQ